MVSSLQKTRKQISKKRSGLPTALHEKSRDSLRLHKASVRDQRLGKLAESRSRMERPILERATYIHDNVAEKEGEAVSMDTVRGLIDTFIHQYDEEYHSLKKTRRPGRPGTAREDLLKIKIEALKREYEEGFYIPDVISADNAKKFFAWEGSWAYLTTVPWIKVTSSGQHRPTDFPSKGLN